MSDTMAWPLLHRDTELAVIDEALAGLLAGTPSVLMILGRRGAGKTSLLTAALARQPGPGVVLRARCHETEREFPFGVVHQLFDPYTPAGRAGRTPAGQPAGAGQPDDGGEPVAGVLPGRELITQPGSVPSHDVLHSMFRAARSLAVARPLIIAIDDLTKADHQSLRWCRYIARRLDGLPVAMILTGDPDDDGAAELVAELSTPSYTSILRPGPLCVDCVARSIGTVSGGPVDPAITTACHRLTQGNPLVLRELTERLAAAPSPATLGLDQVVAIGAATLAETTLDWLGARDSGVAQVLEHFAILGSHAAGEAGTALEPDADLETAAVLAGRGELLADQARRTLRRLGVLADTPPDRFSHEAFRTASLARLAPQARHELHQRAASLLHLLGAPAEQTAEHLMSAGPTGCSWAVDVLTRAATDAVAAAAWGRAGRYLRRALAESGTAPAGSLVADLAAVELHRDLPACVRHLHTLLDLVAAPADRARLAQPLAHALLTVDTADTGRLFGEAARQLAGGRASGGRASGGRDAGSRAAGDGPAGDGLAEDGAPLLFLAAQGLLVGHRGAARACVRLVDKGGSGAASRVFLAAWALATAVRGRARDRTLRLVERCVDGAQLLDTEAAGWADVGVAVAYGWADQLDDAAYWAQEAVARAAGRNSTAEHGFAFLALADIHYRRGELDAADAAAGHAGRLAEECGAAGLRAGAAAVAARVRIDRGDLDQARTLLARLDPRAAPHPLVWGAHLEARGLLAVASGRPRDGLRLFLDCGYQLAARGIANPACVPWRAHAVHAQVALGELGPARAMAREDLAYARAWGAPVAEARALVAAAATSPAEQALGLLRHAVDLLADTGAALEHARALVRLGVVRHEAGDEAAARDVLGRGAELAARAGATRLTAAAQDRLVAAGARRRGEHPVRRTPLTPGERRVIELVVQGMSSVEVAQALMISRRTVDTHLARVYRKLGIRSRTRLAAALAELVSE